MKRSNLLSKQLKFSQSIARQTGTLLRKIIRQKNRVVAYKQSEKDLVTEADKLAEKFLIKKIKSQYPDHLIISEESASVSNGQHAPLEAERSGAGFKWIIDPLDGTTNYAHQYPCYAVSIALAACPDFSENKNNEIILGVVYNPNLDEMFYGIKGGGAYLNGQRLSVSRTQKLSRSFLSTGFSYDIRTNPGKTFTHFRNFCLAAQAVRRAGSAALDLCYVAAGRFDGFWERDLHLWDVAAGALLVTEAGGQISNYQGKNYQLSFTSNYKQSLGTVASNGYIHQPMLKVLM